MIGVVPVALPAFSSLNDFREKLVVEVAIDLVPVCFTGPRAVRLFGVVEPRCVIGIWCVQATVRPLSCTVCSVVLIVTQEDSRLDAVTQRLGYRGDVSAEAFTVL